MSKEKLNEKSVVIPTQDDYNKIYGKIMFNPTMITCSCGSCNKGHEIEEINEEVLSELKW